jgi:hypothetical protein
MDGSSLYAQVAQMRSKSYMVEMQSLVDQHKERAIKLQVRPEWTHSIGLTVCADLGFACDRVSWKPVVNARPRHWPHSVPNGTSYKSG